MQTIHNNNNNNNNINNNNNNNNNNIIIIDVLGGWSREVDLAMRELFGTRGGDVLLDPHAEGGHLSLFKHCAHF